MKTSESSNKISEQDEENELLNKTDETEKNQQLIEQLKARIEELEDKGNKLIEEKEQLEVGSIKH